jgi:hypothetical protein
LEEGERRVDVEPGLSNVRLYVLHKGRRRDAPSLRHPLRRRRHEGERERGFWAKAKWRREERNQAAQTDREKNL